MSQRRRQNAQAKNIALGLLLGSFVGAAFWGTKGALWCGIAGALVGGALNPERS